MPGVSRNRNLAPCTAPPSVFPGFAFAIDVLIARIKLIAVNMAAHFGLSRVQRDANKPTVQPLHSVGPGSYAPPGALETQGPAYIPFNSTGKREIGTENRADEPGPGDYNLSIDLRQTGSDVAGLKSKTKRFLETVNDGEDNQYSIPSCIKNGRPKQFDRQSRHNGMEQLENVKKNVPSIPTRHQSTGYEQMEDSHGYTKLVLQSAVEPGFSGT